MGRAILLKTLRSLLATEGADRIEVVIVGVIQDGAVLERVRELIATHPHVRHLSIRFEKGDASEKRNAGLRATRAPIVAFIDDDVYVPPHWIRRVLAAFEPPEVGMVSGPSLVPTDISLLARLAGLALSSRAAGSVAHRYIKSAVTVKRVKWSRIIGCNMIFRRDAIEKLNGFDPEFYPGEEMIAAFGVAKQGYALVFDSEAYVYHYPKTTFRGFWRQIYRYGATRIRLMRAGLDVEWTPLVPGAWVASLVACGAAAAVHPWGVALLAANLISYSAVALWITLEVVAQTRRAPDLLLIFVQPFMHLAYGIGIWAEIFRPDKDLSDALGKPTT
jgi:glycosyltransferase involved in cell wall biosynthesis